MITNESLIVAAVESPFAFVSSYCSPSERSDELSRVIGMFVIALSSDCY